jgi:hypothetical protein
MVDAVEHIALEPVRVVLVAHGPALCPEPALEDLGCPAYAVESCAVAQNGGDISRVVFLIPDEFKGNGPKRSDGDEDEAWGGVEGVEMDVVRFERGGVYGVVPTTLGAVGWRDDGMMRIPILDNGKKE